MTQRWRFQASNSQTDTWEYDYNTANEQIAMTLNAGTVRHWRLHNQNIARASERDPYGNPYAASGIMTLPRIHALHECDTALRQYRAYWRGCPHIS